MKLFTELFVDLDSSTKTNDKLKALVKYFDSAPTKDAAWALYFLLGNKVPRPASSGIMREWIAESANVPLWLLEECYHIVGDLAETFSLLIPTNLKGTSIPLSELVEVDLLSIEHLPLEAKKDKLNTILTSLSQQQAFVAMKLITGGFRSGVQKTLIARALSKIAGVSQAQLSHRLMGKYEPKQSSLDALLRKEDSEKDLSQPYPFCLAHPLESELIKLGEVSSWLAEWKWDGIRSQVIHRTDEVLIWSRGEELISETFPELSQAFSTLPLGTVLDGEIIVWQNDKPMPFSALQTRLGRKKVSAKILKENPAHFIAYDILEFEGQDIRELPTKERKVRLEVLVKNLSNSFVTLSPEVHFSSWEELRSLREKSREMSAEGFMIKSLEASYGVGRKKGNWWKWKIDPHTCDAIMMYAQRGHGRRAGLFTDYTFGVWKGSEIVPVAKAYSGLTDKEFAEVNRFIRNNTLERFGPVVSVKPEMVFELSFDDIRVSKRHKAGLALRFPRMTRIRDDKTAKDADTIETLLALVPSL